VNDAVFGSGFAGDLEDTLDAVLNVEPYLNQGLYRVLIRIPSLPHHSWACLHSVIVHSSGGGFIRLLPHRTEDASTRSWISTPAHPSMCLSFVAKVAAMFPSPICETRNLDHVPLCEGGEIDIKNGDQWNGMRALCCLLWIVQHEESLRQTGLAELLPPTPRSYPCNHKTLMIDAYIRCYPFSFVEFCILNCSGHSSAQSHPPGILIVYLQSTDEEAAF